MRSVDKFLIWNARSKGASERQTLFLVMLPCALPYIFAGVRVATSFSFLLVVAAEMLSASNGLGFRILYAQRTFEAETMYAAILVVATLGFTVDRIIGLIGRRLLAWQDTAVR
jgi:ABC-type nitrate/sulfonate/bicarbonate transport system permease component